jgi:hypothetical protein
MSADELVKAVKEMPMEKFRLTVNRVKGWNFIRSNNYSVSVNGAMIYFSGYGLGHNCGLSQKGSMMLSERGYSRYEILEHYYRGIAFQNTGSSRLPYNLSYAVFNLSTGQILYASNTNFPDRLITPGSTMKLVTALYLSGTSSFKTYRYTCTGKSDDHSMPVQCWNPDGHGDMDVGSALASSCNLFFASLYRIIDFNDYLRYYRKLADAINITAPEPHAANDPAECRVYTGLNFGLTLSIKNIIDIYRLTQPDCIFEGKALSLYNMTDPEKKLYFKTALANTFVTGTGKFTSAKSGDAANYAALPASPELMNILKTPDDCRGKTSSMTDGTNTPAAYGIFVGSRENTGVIAVLKNGTGHDAAQWGKILLNGKYK